MKNYYEVLEIDFQASQENIKKAFRQKAIKYHPDKHFGDKYFTEKFIEVVVRHKVMYYYTDIKLKPP